MLNNYGYGLPANGGNDIYTETELVNFEDLIKRFETNDLTEEDIEIMKQEDFKKYLDSICLFEDDIEKLKEMGIL